MVGRNGLDSGEISAHHSGMAKYEIEIQGTLVRCEEPADVLRLIRATTQGLESRPEPESRPRGRPPVNGVPRRELRDENSRTTAVALMRALNTAGNAGLDADAMVRALGIRGTKGIGGALISVRRVLQTAGFQPESAYRMLGERGHRRWKAGSQIQDVIAKLAPNGESSDWG